MVKLDPPADLPVNPTPLFDGANCIVPPSVCVDSGNDCGNSCAIPEAMTCDQIATLFGLTLPRFQQLNPTLSCTGVIAAATDGTWGLTLQECMVYK